jgi:hypothetical protein
LSIASLSLSGTGPRLTVVSDNSAWLKQNASSLRIRAAATPAMDDTNSVLLVPDVTLNGDGSATISVSQPLSGVNFFKVEQRNNIYEEHH